MTIDKQPTMARLARCLMVTGLVAGAAGAQAFCSNVVLGAGVIHIAPRNSSGPLVLESAGGRPVGQAAPGSGVKIKDAETLLLTGDCEIDEHMKLRVSIGSPPKHELAGAGTMSPAGVVGSARQYSPALLGIYTFLPAETTVRPFLGAGLNYTFFRSASISNAQFSAANFGPNATTKVSLSPSWNPVFIAGLRFRIDDRWSIGTDVTYLPVNTRISVAASNTAAGVPLTYYVDAKNRTLIGTLTLHYKL